MKHEREGVVCDDERETKKMKCDESSEWLTNTLKKAESKHHFFFFSNFHCRVLRKISNIRIFKCLDYDMKKKEILSKQ